MKDLQQREDNLKNYKRPIIDKGTLIPIGFVIAIVAGAMFFGSLVTRVDANEKDIVTIQDKLDSLATKDDLNKVEKNIKEFIQK